MIKDYMPTSDQLWSFVRPVIAVVLLGDVTYLMCTGNTVAVASVTAAFSILIGAIWGERAALKKPGQDGDNANSG